MYLDTGLLSIRLSHCYAFDIGSSALCTNSSLSCLHFGRLPTGTFTPTLVVLSVQRFIYCFEYILA